MGVSRDGKPLDDFPAGGQIVRAPQAGNMTPKAPDRDLIGCAKRA